MSALKLSRFRNVAGVTSGLRFLRFRSGVAGLVIVTFIVLLAIFGPLFAPHSPSITIVAPGASPSGAAPLGGDFLGRDVLSRVLWGGRSVLGIAAVATLLVYVISVPLALLAGAGGTVPSQAIMRLMDTFRVFPPLLFFLVLISGLGSSRGVLILGVVVTQVPAVTRILYSPVLEVSVRGYVEAAVARGERLAAVLRREILPNILSPLIADCGLRFSYSILLVAGVNFLGLGLQPPAADWGLMIAENRDILSTNPWALVVPGILIASLTIGASLIGDAITRSLGRTRVGLGGARGAERMKMLAANPLLGAAVTEASGSAHSEHGDGGDAGPLPPELATAALGVRNLTIKLDDGPTVVDKFEVTVEPGQTLGLVGESGSGKTTVALALMGYARKGMTIASGTVAVGGQQMNLRDDEAAKRLRGRMISYVPQDPGNSLNPSLRIRDAVRDVLEANGRDRTDVGQVLQRVHLPSDAEFQSRFPHQLSGGQQQRVVIGVAASAEPPVVLFDEPTTGLDVVTQDRILDEIERLREEQHVAMVYVSHDLAVISRVADRIGVMYAGKLVEEGTAEQVLRRPRHPYTRGLVESIPDHLSPRRLKAMPGIAVGPEERPPGCPFAPRCDQSTQRCTTEMPALLPVGPDQHAACFCWEQTPKVQRGDPLIPAERSAQASPLLELSHLAASYGTRGRKQTIVHDLSFEIFPGECVGLVGESGSGKTTIARCVAGLHAPDGGELKLEQQALAAHARRRLREQRRRCQIVFQNPYDSLNPRRRVIDQVARPARMLRGLSADEARAAAMDRLEQVRLPVRVAEQFPGELSGGERQRVAIARALAADPDLLICDEVTSSLDVSVQAAVLELLSDLRQQLRMALLFVSHDLGVVATICDRVVVIDKGEICEAGPVASVLHGPSHGRTKELLDAAPRLSIEPDERQDASLTTLGSPRQGSSLPR